MIELICKNGNYSEWENDPAMYFVREDKNGTRYYTDTKCPKCNGEGYLSYYAHVDGGICFLCGGTGKSSRQLKVYTPEYFQVLTNRRREKAIKAAKTDNLRWLKKQGFTPEGKTYIVLGNTFAIKDQLKAAGAHFNHMLGWHFDKPVDDYPIREVTAADIIDADEYGDPITLIRTLNNGHYDFPENPGSVQNYIKRIQDEYFRMTMPETKWYGALKERVTLHDCTVQVLAIWENMYGSTVMYKFASPEGYQFIWKTASFAVDPEIINSNKKITVTGTVKSHAEYKGQKQTELTRCKISTES